MRASAEPATKLLVLGKLADLSRRHELPRAVWPLERSIEVRRRRVRHVLGRGVPPCQARFWAR
eukprot:5794271-Prymnesium_polylepis.1